MAARQAQTNRNRCSEAERRKEPLTEASFNSFFSSKRDVLDTYFRSGYLFNPFVFGSFTDPSDPIPLWNYTPYTIWPRETVSLSKSRVDWSQTDDGIIMRADLPGLKKDDVDVTVENGRVLKINGQWNHVVYADCLIYLNVAGLKKDDVDVTVENGRVLKINGQWNHNKRQDDCGEWWKEEYMRRFILPENGDIEQAHASMDDGVLEIRIPKTMKKRPPPTLHSVEVTD